MNGAADGLNGNLKCSLSWKVTEAPTCYCSEANKAARLGMVLCLVYETSVWVSVNQTKSTTQRNSVELIISMDKRADWI